MDERSLKRMGVMVLTAIVIILVLKYIGVRMATNAKLTHEKQVAARLAAAPASAPSQAVPPAASPETGGTTVPLSGDGTAAPPTPNTSPAMPDAASAPAVSDEPPATADPTVSTPPASLNAN